jgi:hypothetical protein
MAPRYCPECGAPVSALAITCPKCGRPLRKLPGGIGGCSLFFIIVAAIVFAAIMLHCGE